MQDALITANTPQRCMGEAQMDGEQTMEGAEHVLQSAI